MRERDGRRPAHADVYDPLMHPVRVGLKVSAQAISANDLLAVWRFADASGFDHIWGFDHFGPGVPYPASGDVYEGWTTLGAMAIATSRARIGLMVTGNTYRHPGVLAKMAVTVDHLSGGRLEFGIGAAWVEEEHTMFGLEFGTTSQRIERLRESVTAIKSLWTLPSTTLVGSHYVIREAYSDPKPVQTPHPPIWIGGAGERKTLRVVAELADVWNMLRGDPSEAGRLSRVLDQHCADVGRPPTEIRRSIQIMMSPPEEARVTINKATGYLEEGFTEIILIVRSPEALRYASVAAYEIAPAIRAAARKRGLAVEAQN